MLSSVKIGTRILIGFAVTLAVTLAIITPTVLGQIGSIIDEAEDRELRSMYDAVRSQIETQSGFAEAMSALVAEQPEVRATFAERDRETLVDQFHPAFERLSEEHGVAQFQFHTPTATSFLRVHALDNYGDDLTDRRPTIVETNRRQQPIRGLDGGVFGIGIRGLSPVYSPADEHIGSVEFGLNLAQDFADTFTEEFGANMALHTLEDRDMNTLASNIPGDTFTDAEAVRAALGGERVMRRAERDGTRYATVVRAIPDFDGNHIAVVEIAMDRDFYATAMSTSRNSVLIIGLIAIAAGLAIAWFIGRSIVRPVNDTVEAMCEIAEGEGDLTKRLDESGKDEIAALAHAFNLFAQRVQATVSEVGGSTEQLASAAEEMSTITAETNQNTQRQREETEQVVTAMNEMTATVQDVARNAESAAEAAREADVSAQQGSQVVDRTITGINNLAQEVESAAETINRLGSDTDNIGSVLDVIREVADQTNLLALNAAIEAARAGEAGRGFAVVADEVRTLASRTQDSTQEIQAMIERLQSGSREAVEAMENSRSRAHSTVEEAGNASESLGSITQSVSRISEMNDQIASAAEEQSSVADEINRNIVSINDISEQTAEGATQTATAGDQLARLANQLQNLVAKFKY
ncbi:methyl-accepting chemotaxis protein [Aquisalimonas sp.]|uniref:methyl-accepting chemotaxis protein n=1 Tax=unclassified Aquisalimonas TaxID=2644645 RepID=UPI0025C5CB94|nr:methyl-accepting chemotaxis protein [Aquisalimonas sp.]